MPPAELVLGLPGAGKTWFLRRRALDVGSVLWLTFLRQDRLRVADWFRARGRRVVLLPSKPESCGYAARVLERWPAAYPGLAAACRVCPLRSSCRYYRAVEEAREALESGDAVVVGSLAHYVLGFAADMVVLDEFDAVAESAYRPVPCSVVRQAAAWISAELGGEAGREFREAFIEIAPGLCIPRLGSLYPLLPRVASAARVYLVSATVSPRPGGAGWGVVVPEDLPLVVRVLPPPARPDRFHVSRSPLYAAATPSWVYARLARAVKSAVAAGETVLILVRSRGEAARVAAALSRVDVAAAVEGVNAQSARELAAAAVRVIVIGGRLHRSLDVDSGVVYAFYQHPPPDGGGDVPAEVASYARHAKHVQTLFRGLRDWRRGHRVALLDSYWLRSLGRFEHIMSYVEPRLEAAPLAELLTSSL